MPEHIAHRSWNDVRPAYNAVDPVRSAGFADVHGSTTAKRALTAGLKWGR